MRRRHVAPCAAILATATTVAGWAQSAAGVQVSLTFAPDLPVPARIAVIEQAAEIWTASGIAIEWRAGGGPCEAGRCVRALVVRRPLAPRGDVARQVGELVRIERGGAALIVSVDEAERIVREAPARLPRFGLLEGDPLGTVLGRAMAHELGHYLLDTATHARNGLMRAQFAPREFTDLRSNAFALDDAALAWLRTRAVPEGLVSSFSYR